LLNSPEVQKRSPNWLGPLFGLVLISYFVFVHNKKCTQYFGIYFVLLGLVFPVRG